MRQLLFGKLKPNTHRSIRVIPTPYTPIPCVRGYGITPVHLNMHPVIPLLGGMTVAQYTDFARKIRSTLNRIENSKISPHNKAIIARFLKHMEAEGLSLSRIDRNLDLAKIYAESLEPKKLDEVTREDIEGLVGSWNKAKNARTGTPWTASTRSTYRTILKKFYRWLLGKNGQSPEQTAWIKSSIPTVESEVINPSDMFSESDVRKLIDASDNIRDKAFIGGLYDSACRPEEYITLRVGDVQVDEQITRLRIRKGKMGQRYVSLVLFPGLMTAWLNVHPQRNDKDAPLWIMESTNKLGQPFTYQGARLLFKALCLKAFFGSEWKKTKGKNERLHLIKKHLRGQRWTLYNLRHSRATELVKLGVSISALQRHMGHSRINRTQRYTHLSDKDVSRELMRAQGMETEEPVKRVSELRPRVCAKCKETNDATSDFCKRCGGALTLEVAQRMQDAQLAFIESAIRRELDKARTIKFAQEELIKRG